MAGRSSPSGRSRSRSGRRAAIAAWNAATVRGRRTRSDPTSVPSRSIAISRIGKRASIRRRHRRSGRARPLARRRPARRAALDRAALDPRDPIVPGEVRDHRRSPAGQELCGGRDNGRALVRRRSRGTPPRRDAARGRAVRSAGGRGRGRPARRRAPSPARTRRRSAARADRLTGYRAGSPRRSRTGVASQGTRSPSSNWIRSATPWPTAFSRASWRASGEASVAIRLTSVSIRRLRSSTASAITIVPAPVPTSITRSAGVPAGRGAEISRSTIEATHEVDEQLRLGPRDQGPRIRRQGNPVELLEAPDVGHRLAGDPADEPGLERGGRVGADRARRNGRSAPSGRPAGRGRGAARRRAAGSPSRPSAAVRSPHGAGMRHVTEVTPRRARAPTGAVRPGRW